MKINKEEIKRKIVDDKNYRQISEEEIKGDRTIKDEKREEMKEKRDEK